MQSTTSRRAPLAGLGLAVAVFLLGLEIALRLVPSAIPMAVLENFEPELRSRIAESRHIPTRKDTVLVPRTDGGPADLLWVYRPGAEVTWALDEPGIVKTVQMDAAGFCNPPPASSDPASFDVVAVGDSLTFCTAVAPADTWVARIAPMLPGSAYNLALPNRGLYEYLQMLASFGLPKHPRVVVMTVYEGNDFRDAYIYRSALERGGQHDAAAVCPFGRDIFCRGVAGIRDSKLGRHSFAINLAAGFAWRMALKASKGEIDFRYQARLADGATLELNSRNGDRDEVTYARALTSGKLGTELFDEALSRFVTMGAEHDFAPVVVYLPSAYTAYAAVARFEDPAIEQVMRDYSDRLRAYFAGKAQELGFAYLDATPALSAAAARATAADPVFFPANVHLTNGGHEVVAKELSAFLKQNGLLGASSSGG